MKQVGWAVGTRRTRPLGVSLLVLACLAPLVATPISANAASAQVESSAGAPSAGDLEPIIPQDLQNIDIVDRLGSRVPLSAVLTDDTGASVPLSRYFSGEPNGKPVLLVLGYYTCPMLCSMVLNATFEALKGVDLLAGRDFEIVSVSIDPRDAVEVAHDKRETYLKLYDRENADAGVHFHIAEPAVVKALADSVGFTFRWDEKTKQYAHAAGIFFLSPDGTLTRTLYGLTFSPTDVKFALMEASRGEVGSIVDKVILSCFSYTPDSQRYGVYIFGLFRLGGVLTILFLGGLLIHLWRREHAKSRGVA